MYRTEIINNGVRTVIQDISADKRRKLASGKITREPNSISSYSFEIYPQNIGYDDLHPFQTTIDVWNTQKQRYEFRGRVLKAYPEMDESGIAFKRVICEDRMGYLNDSIQPYVPMHHYTGDENRTGLEEFIDVILSNHNSHVEQYKRIYRGVVTVNPFLTSDDVTKELSYEKTWVALKSRLIDSFGGYLILRETNGTMYLDYLAEPGQLRNTKIALGRNMKSASRELDPTKAIARLYPLGAKISAYDETGQLVETEERVSIRSVNGGLDYIDADEYTSQFGVIEDTHVWDDVTVPTNLLSKARAYLANSNGIYSGNRITALDLSLLGLDPDEFKLFDSYPAENALIGLNDTLQIVKQSIDTVTPEQSTFEMGDTVRRMSDLMAGSSKPKDGKPGRSSFLHIRYSANADGTDMTSAPTSTTKYIGFAETTSAIAPTDKTAYTWSAYVGRDGADGVSITATTPYYAKGTSKTVKPSDPSTPTWTVQPPALQYGEYLWCAYLITYSAGSPQWTEPFYLKSADELLQASTAPANPTEGMLWLDTSSDPYMLMRFDGTAWQVVADTTAQMNAIFDRYDSRFESYERSLEGLTQEFGAVSRSVSDNRQIIETMSTVLGLDAQGMSLTFKAITESLQALNGSVQTQQTNIEKYIRFVNGTIEIGQRGADTLLKLENDILGFYQNGVRVAYFNSGKLYVDNLEAITSLQLGRYSFVPNSTGGMSLKYTGG